jgi:hypothetical protein
VSVPTATEKNVSALSTCEKENKPTPGNLVVIVMAVGAVVVVVAVVALGEVEQATISSAPTEKNVSAVKS